LAGQTTYRRAAAGDVESIAALHADSWQRNYRGALSDEFLDGDVVSDRLTVWRERLTQPQPNTRTVVAELEGIIVGLAHTVLEDDERWGALLDNLHVVHRLKGQGIGTRLLAETARLVVQSASSSALYLWVLGQNTAAQAFYDARGGTSVERQSRHPEPGERLRYVWPDPSILLLHG
jgi:ribosomal protein S18 acetylase RimI-like enzyme